MSYSWESILTVCKAEFCFISVDAKRIEFFYYNWNSAGLDVGVHLLKQTFISSEFLYE